MNSEAKLNIEEGVKIEAGCDLAGPMSSEMETHSNFSESSSRAGESTKKPLIRKKSIYKPKKKYSIIPQDRRQEFIRLVLSKTTSIKEAAEQSGIKFSTAKAILQTYRREGRIGKKKTRERRRMALPPLELAQDLTPKPSSEAPSPKAATPQQQNLASLLSYQPVEGRGILNFIQSVATTNPRVLDTPGLTPMVHQLQSYISTSEMIGKLIQLSKEEICRMLSNSNVQPSQPPQLPMFFQPQIPVGVIPSNLASLINLSILKR
eukprot:TRINITY_DN1020_c0_g1_i1.p1 TRINITY_DN1020_c0_g1~~TRINITY_DN1020_c0_g1_i1.p1  ORF type:complete len:263 (-),score=75.07 TRINITY_DN1020_c0_g1_i1:485-1273(-)